VIVDVAGGRRPLADQVVGEAIELEQVDARRALRLDLGETAELDHSTDDFWAAVGV
jgi:hypothetical protein